MHTFYFEKLDVWQNSRAFVKLIYTESNSFPEEEKYGITNQLRRASISISANIAEGFSRNSNKEKDRFLNVAYSSAMEVISFVILAYDLHYLSEEKYESLRQSIEHITNQINALSKRIGQ